MAWNKVSPTRLERPLGETEQLVWLIGMSTIATGRDEWHLFVTAQLRFGSNSDRFSEQQVALLKHAWKRLRFQHPSIAAVTDGAVVAYEIPDSGGLETWVEQTCIVEEGMVEAEEIMATERPCDQMLLHVIPRGRRIILSTVHWRSDGRGMPQLLNDFLANLNFPATNDGADVLGWGSETSRLCTCLEVAARMTDSVSPEDNIRIKSMATQLLKGSPALQISCLGAAATPPGIPRRCLHTLTSEKTAALIAACKARDFTVTAAVHAAIAIMNIHNATPDSKELEYRSSIRRDLRDRLPQCTLGNDNQPTASAAALFNTATIINLPPNETWVELARRLTNEYRSGYPDDIFHLHRVYYAQLVSSIKEAAVSGTQAAARAADVDISSIGLIENLVQHDYLAYGGDEDKDGAVEVEVENFTLSVNTISRQAAVFVFTFRGCLNLYLTYNEAFHSKEAMTAFSRGVEDVLVTELNV